MMITREQIASTYDTIKPYIRETPVIEVDAADLRYRHLVLPRAVGVHDVDLVSERCRSAREGDLPAVG